MPDVQTDTGVMADGSQIKSSVLNVADKVFMTNQAAGTVETGDVLTFDIAHDESFIYGSSAHPYSLAFVVPSDIALDGTASNKQIASGDSGWIYKPGAYVPLANVDGAVDIGEYLTFSSTDKKFTGTNVVANNSGVRPTSAKAIALNSAAGVGQIPVLLLPLHGITTRRARVYNNAAIALTQNALTLMTFNTERYDTSAMHSTAVNPGRFTIPIDLVGCAIFEINMYLRNTASPTPAGMYIIVRLNGADIIMKQSLPSGSYAVASISTQFCLTAGDYVEILIFTTGAGDTIGAGFSNSYYSPEASISQIGEAYLG
jgi:hypothetical protein